MKAWEKAKIDKRWKESAWCKKIEAKKKVSYHIPSEFKEHLRVFLLRIKWSQLYVTGGGVLIALLSEEGKASGMCIENINT